MRAGRKDKKGAAHTHGAAHGAPWSDGWYYADGGYMIAMFPLKAILFGRNEFQSVFWGFKCGEWVEHAMQWHTPHRSCPLVCGSSQVAHGLCEVPSMKVLTRGMMKEHWWGSMTWVSSWPFIPCYAGHRPLVTKLTHVIVLVPTSMADSGCRSEQTKIDRLSSTAASGKLVKADGKSADTKRYRPVQLQASLISCIILSFDVTCTLSGKVSGCSWIRQAPGCQNHWSRIHVSFKVLIEGKHCNFKKRQSWVLNTETNSKLLVQSNECQEFSEDVKRMVMQIYAVHTSFDHFDWNMLKLFRSPKNWILDVYILLFLLVCGSSQVAHGLCEVPSMKVLTRGMMKEHWWGSMTWVSSWPFIPCYAGHRPLVTKLTHVVVLAMSCCPLISVDV